jgi:hypothetical protein
VPEKSSAATLGGKYRLTIEAGRAMTMTASTANTTTQMNGRT